MDHTPTPAALIVGCLPSFAIFIRGRVEATRVQLFDSSPNIPSNPFSRVASSRTSTQGRTDSLTLEDDIERVMQHRDDRSNKGSIDGNVATQGWSQRWHRGIAINTDSIGTEKLGQRSDV